MSKKPTYEELEQRIKALEKSISEHEQTKIALQKNDKRYQEAQLLGAVGNWDYDLLTSHFWGSEGSKRIYGFKSDTSDITAEEVESCIPDRERVHQALVDLIENGKEYNLEFDIITQDTGQRKTIHSVAKLEKNAEGQPIKVSGVITDITKRKEAEEALKEKEYLYKETQRIAKMGGWSYDVESKQATFTDTIFEIYGTKITTAEEGTQFYHQDDRKLVLDAFNDAITKQKPYDLEVRFTNAQGKQLFVRTTAKPFIKNGKVVKIYGNLVDITKRKMVEEELKSNRLLLRNVLDIVPSFICAKNLDGKFILINKKLTDFYGTTVEDMTNALHSDLCEDENELRTMLEADREVIESGKPKFIPEETMENPDGSITVLETHKIPFTALGEPAVLIASNDITDRKQTEDALKESEEKYRLIDNASVDYIYSYDLDGRFTHANPRLIEFLDLPLEQILGKTHRELNYPEDICKKWDELHKRVCETNTTVYSETSSPNQSGELCHYEVILNPLHNAKGTIIGIAGVTRDITEQKKAEKELEASIIRERFLADIVRKSSVGIAIGYPDGHLGMCNLAYQHITGYSEEELKTIDWNAILTPPKWKESESAKLQELQKTKKPVKYEKEYIRKDGSIIPIELIVNPQFNDSGEVECYFAFVIDITERKKTEEALIASEIKFRELFEQTGGYCMILDPNTPDGIPIIIDVNEAACLMHGYKKADLIGQPISKIDDEAGKMLVKKRTAEIMTGKPFYMEHTHLRKDGTTFHVAVNAKRIDIGNNPPIIFTVEYDITDKVLAEKAILESKQKLELLIKNSPDMLMTQKTNSDITYVSPQCKEITGFTEEEIKARDMKKQIHPDDFDYVINQELATLGGKQVINIEYRIINKNGDIVWIHHTARPIILDGKIVEVQSTVRDITEQKQAEARLIKSEEKYRNLIEYTPLPIAINDNDNNITYVNNRFTKVLGYTLDDIPTLNEWWKKAYPDPQYRAWVLDTWDSYVRTAQENNTDIESAEYNVTCKSGNVLNVIISGISLNDGFLVTLMDITNRKRAEEEHEKLRNQLLQSQKMESVGRLAGGVAHDYNNISSIILGYSELALDKVEPSDPLYDDLIEILTAAKRSADITRQLLAFARKQTISPKVLDLNDTIETMLNMLRRLIGEDIDLVWVTGAGIKPIKIDPSQINQILVNLCVNARDAIANIGRITVETKDITFDEDYCSDHAEFVPGEYVQITVSDDGCGMSQETLNNIFEPFFTTKDVGKGTGLGLSTVYGIVKQNKGFINAYSEADKGTTFRIYLPIYMGDETKEKSKNTMELQLSRGETIIVVDDDKSILQIVKRSLERLGYKVLSSHSPEEAIKLVAEHSDEINLLVTDVIMPKMNGRELSERLQSMYPNLKALFMSGYTADIITDRGMLQNGVSFISKPFSNNELAAAVRKVLDEETI